ncbi:O-antigen ligase family protein [Bacillus haimaensis]|uniref:O-antigen ligase family protein n=1 Tax=Bacillus haimaensis TaxID=3160967 RepID=UPI003AA9C140
MNFFSVMLFLLYSKPYFINVGSEEYSLLIEESFFGKDIITGPFISVNEFGDLQVLIILLNLFLIKEKPKFSIINIGLASILLLLTISRTSIFLSIIVVFIYLLLFFKDIKPSVKYFIVPSGIVFLGFTIIENYGENLLYFMNKFNQDKILSGREYLWEASFSAIKESPLIGIPPEKLRILLDRYLDQSLEGLGAHNMYIHVMSIAGLIGFVAIFFILFFIIYFINYTNLNRNHLFLLAGFFITVFLRGFFESGIAFIFSTRIFIVWALIGYILGFSKERVKKT